MDLHQLLKKKKKLIIHTSQMYKQYIFTTMQLRWQAPIGELSTWLRPAWLSLIVIFATHH